MKTDFPTDTGVETRCIDKVPSQRLHYRQSWPVLLLVLLGLVSCIDEIDFTRSANLQTAFTAEGTLVYGQPTIVTLSLRRLFDGTGTSLRPLNAREVVLLNDANQRIPLTEVEVGLYRVVIPLNHPDFEISFDRSYSLRLTTFDNRIFVSLPEKIVSSPATGELRTILAQRIVRDLLGNQTRQDVLEYQIVNPLAIDSDGKPAKYLWNLEYTWQVKDSPNNQIDSGKICYITEKIDVNSVSVFDGTQAQPGADAFIRLYQQQPNWLFASGYYLHVYQQTLSQTAYDYWASVSQVINRNGNMFEPAPGTVRTNFQLEGDDLATDEIFGYFYCTTVDTLRLYISPQQAGNPAPACPWPPDSPSLPGQCPRVPCCNCLAEPRSSLTKPHYWEF